MAHFYGTLKGARGEATRLGHKQTGLRTCAASWAGSVRVYLSHDETTGLDLFNVTQKPWHGEGIRQASIAAGFIGTPVAFANAYQLRDLANILTAGVKQKNPPSQVMAEALQYVESLLKGKVDADEIAESDETFFRSAKLRLPTKQEG